MSDDMSTLVFAAVAVAFLLGVFAERQRAAFRRRAWKRRMGGKSSGKPLAFRPPARAGATDPAEQLRTVMTAEFRARRLLSRSEARMFLDAEQAVRDHGLSWRVMAQVSLGEVLSCADPKAYGAVNSKRVDVLLVTRGGHPVAALEHQGGGHYQGTAPVRDAVKKEALRRAGIGYVEFTPEHGAEDVAREIARLARGKTRESADRV